MSPQLDRPDPPYVQVVRHFRNLIASGELKEGDRLPSARQISESWRISHATAAKVLATMRSEGLTKGVQGVGTVVTTADVSHASAERLRAVRTTGRIYPSDERAQIISARTVEAPQQIADALGVETDAVVIRRDRVTFKADSPVTVSTSWLPGALADAAPRLLETERIIEGTFGYIASATGRSVADVREQYAGGQADEDAASRLGIDAGAAVLCKRSWFLDGAGDVIEYGESTTIAGRWVAPRGQ